MHKRNFTLDIGDEVKHPCGIGTVRQRARIEDGNEWYLVRFTDQPAEWIMLGSMELNVEKEERGNADQTKATVPEDGMQWDN